MSLENQYIKSKLWLWISYILPILVGLIAGFILIRWLVQPELMTELFPMQFNTALCFILYSIALLGLCYGCKKVSKLAVLAVLFIALITLIQYGIKKDLGIDTLFIAPLVSINSIFLGKMAPNTAIAFIFISLSLILALFNFKFLQQRILSVSLLASIGLALGLFSLIGYLTNIETAYAWVPFTRMSLYTAVCFVFLGLATISYIWYHEKTEAPWLPIPIFIILFTLTLSITASIYIEETLNYNKLLKNNGQNAANQTHQSLESLIQALNRMATRWNTSGGTSERLWQADARAYLKDFPYLIALELLDDKLRIRSIEPYLSNANLIGQNLNTDPERQQLVQQALLKKTAVFSNILNLKQNGSGVLCFIPLYKDKKFAGMMVAVFKTSDFFNTIFTQSSFPLYSISIYQQRNRIFSNTLSNDSNPSSFYQTSVNYKNLQWTIVLQPAQPFSNTYLVVFFIGFIMTLLMTWCIYLLIRSFEKTNSLRERKERYRMIVDGIKDYAIILLTPDGKISSWNTSAQVLKGYTEQEILGQHFSIFFEKEEQSNPLCITILETAKLKGKYEDEHKQFRKDGSHFWASLLVQPLYNSNNQLVGFATITRDITTRRELELQQLKLIALIEGSSDFVGISNLEGNLQYHNSCAKQMVGLPDDYDMTRLKIADMHPPWAAKLVHHQGIPAVFSKGFWKCETALLHQDGREIPVLQTLNLIRDSKGNPVCFTTIMRDITERKMQEEALRASEETFRSAIHYAAIGMALVSIEGKWLKVNHALCQMLGYREDELLTSDFQLITHPDDLEIDLNYIQKMLSKKIDNYQLEKRYFHKNRTIIWILLNISLVWDNDGKPKYFIAQIQNISD